jgi:hypothetical protein
MTKGELLRMLRAERGEWEQLLAYEPVAYPGEQPFPRWHHVWENSYAHYREHLDDVRSWLENGR